MTRSELVEKSGKIKKSAKKNSVTLLVYVLLPGGFLWWASFYQIFSEQTIKVVGIAWFLGIYVVLFVTAFITRKQRKQFGCVCPGCKKELITETLRLAIASGRCGYCGGVVVEDWNE